MIYGYIKSKLDGTEHQFASTKLDILETFRYELPKVIDQGQRPICVPCSISSFLNWDIDLKNGDNTKDNNINVEEIFSAGNGKSNGMTFKDALKFVKTKYKLDSYAMIHSHIALKQAILLNGPCVGALIVRDSSRNDFWNGSEIEGGHAISFVGWDKEGFILRNSWGTSFGNNGYTIFPYDDFNKIVELWTLIK